MTASAKKAVLQLRGGYKQDRQSSHSIKAACSELCKYFYVLHPSVINAYRLVGEVGACVVSWL